MQTADDAKNSGTLRSIGRMASCDPKIGLPFLDDRFLASRAKHLVKDSG